MSIIRKTACLYCTGDTEHVATLNLPVPNKYLLTREMARAAEKRPHVLMRCASCGSFSLADAPFTPAELFAGAYAFAPLSASWHAHCVDLARSVKAMLSDNMLNDRGVIYDIGGNDGALTSVMNRVCDRLTIVVDPSDVAPFQNGVHWPKRKGFFGEAFARQLLADGDRQADAITATNVLAHVPNPLDFMRGVKTLLAADGVAVFEFPGGEAFGAGVLFDLLYAEHIGYITIAGMASLCERVGLHVAKVSYVATHGGSWRVFVGHSVKRWVVGEMPTRPNFAEVVTRKLLGLADKVAGKKIIGFGSAAKSVVVNACFADDSPAVPMFIVDETPAKIGRFQPGSGAKILPLPGTYLEAMSDDEKLAHELLAEAEICINYAWNYSDEVKEKLLRAGFRGEIVTVHDF